MSAKLEGKVAIVTGAASGLGLATARRFAREGARVVCADVDEQAAARLAGELAAEGSRAIAVAVDVTREQDVRRMVETTAQAFGGVDVLVANAGIAGVGSVETTSRETWDRVLAVNLTGVWLCNRAVVPAMRARGGGSVINQASIAGLVGFSGIAPYAAAKAGVIGLTRQAAVEYAATGIRFNAVCPGTVVTPLVVRTYEERGGIATGARQSLDDALRANAARIPMQRFGTPEDVASMVAFLASAEAAWITGAVFPVDGGYTAA
ncbi:MAG: SDR family NAD(P)-dependent oxidoreductase [Steroidobacteraceae bacterium]|jgi:NAD(P)-dependent dehydrogenase (short-subunit alcohol dehydrogenase family)|nr:SDR family NAD(P)-dependent oxidoreductase [Steroidobacteraceae bacterium]